MPVSEPRPVATSDPHFEQSPDGAHMQVALVNDAPVTLILEV